MVVVESLFCTPLALVLPMPLRYAWFCWRPLRRQTAGIAQCRALPSPVAAPPVTPLPIHVDPMEAPVFAERQVFPPGDAPKATRRPAPWNGLRFGKGIRVETAEAHGSGKIGAIRIASFFCIPWTRQSNSITVWCILQVRGGAANAPAPGPGLDTLRRSYPASLYPARREKPLRDNLRGFPFVWNFGRAKSRAVERPVLNRERAFSVLVDSIPPRRRVLSTLATSPL
jgi:hypothetical protein